MGLTVAQLLPALRSGGVERGTLEIARALVAEGHRSIVISAGGPLVEGLQAQGSEHRVLPIGRKSLSTLGLVRPLAEALRGVDVVDARSRLPAWIGWRALRRLQPRPRFVTTVHGLYSVSRYSSIMARGERVIAVSRAAADYVQEHYARWVGDRLVVVPRGIDTDAFPRGFQPSAAWTAAFEGSLRGARSAPRLLIAGRWGRRKGHGTLIALLAGLHERGVRAVGLIAGGCGTRDQRYRRRVLAAARQAGVDGALVELGERRDLKEIYAASDVVLSLSEKPESFGRTVLEALSIGTPVVGYAHGGVAELLDAYFPQGAVRPGDVSGLIRTVAGLLDRPPPVAKVTGHRLADMQAQTLRVYSELASNPART